MHVGRLSSPVLLSLTLATLCALPSLATAQQSAARYDAPVVVADEFHRFEYLLDLNGDGFMDALDWWFREDDKDDMTITGWINDQNGELVETWTLVETVNAPSSPQYATAVGDLDNDGLDDFAISVQSTVRFYTSNGATVPSPYATLNHNSTITGMLLADLNGDDLDDLALTDSSNVRLFLNPGANLSFTLSDSFFASFAEGVFPCEVNGDGEADLMTIRGTLIDMHVIENGVRTSVTGISHGMGTSDDNHPVYGDIDNDGDGDVVTFQLGDYVVFRRTGPATFVTETQQVGGPATDLADVDGDGVLDGVCCGGSGDGFERNVWESHFEIALNDGSGAFAPSFRIQAIGAHHIAGVSDLDNDGDADLVAGRVVYYSDGPLDGAPQPLLTQDETSLNERHVADLDGDGDPDFQFGTESAQRNMGDGSLIDFTPTIPDPPLPGGPPTNHRFEGPGYAGDFDGDGDADLLTTWISGGLFQPTFQGMRLLVNNGAGQLFDAGDPAGGLNMNLGIWDDPAGAVIEDLDADGDVDFIATSELGASTTLWLNDGSGSFTLGQAFVGERFQHIADLDGDNVPDLVLSSGLEPTFRLGLGAGAFGAVTTLTASIMDNVRDVVAVGDMDDDGDVDIAAIKDSNDSPVFYWNDGAANFTADTTQLSAYDVHTNSTLKIMHAVDVNGDGRDDVIMFPVEYAFNSSYIFIKKAGQAGWEDPIIQTIAPTGFVDVDGDGDDDIIMDRIVPSLLHVQPDAGYRLQYGEGVDPQFGGTTPVLGARGPFRVGETVQIRMTGMPAGAIGLMGVSFDASELPNTPWLGINGLNWPWVFYFFLPPAPGDGTMFGGGFLTLPYTVDPVVATAGKLYHQAYFADSDAPFNRTATNGLIIEYR